MNKLIIVFSILMFACTSNKLYNSKCDITTMIDHFIYKNEMKTENNSILIVYVSEYDILNKNSRLLTIMEFEKSMYIDHDYQNLVRDYGLYNYKDYEISFISDKNINIIPLTSCFMKISETGFINPNGAIMTYNPSTMKFVINDKLEYLYTYSPFLPNYTDKEDTEEINKILNKTN